VKKTAIAMTLPFAISVTDVSSLLSAAGTPLISVTSTAAPDTSPTGASPGRETEASDGAEEASGDFAPSDILRRVCDISCEFVTIGE